MQAAVSAAPVVERVANLDAAVCADKDLEYGDDQWSWIIRVCEREMLNFGMVGIL